MTLTLKAPPTLPDGMSDRLLAEAGARGISNALKRHFRARNDGSRHRERMPRSNYWAHVRNSVQTASEGGRAIVSIDHEGVALHYFGGTVRPRQGKKALAIPLVAGVWDQNPREFDPSREKLVLVWPKGEKAGLLIDREKKQPTYLLVSKATHKADRTVLPPEESLVQAGLEAIYDSI